MKWWGQHIFKNTQEVLKDRYISAPPDETDYAQWDVPDYLKSDVNFANKATFGKKGESWELEQYRICWYVDTMITGLTLICADTGT